MGVMDFIRSLLGQSEKGKGLRIKTWLSPLRLDAGMDSSVLLYVDVENREAKPIYVTVECKISQGISFDTTGLVLVKEKELGRIDPSQRKRTVFQIHSNRQTKPGRYPIWIHVYLHEPDKVESVIQTYKKKTVVRAV